VSAQRQVLERTWLFLSLLYAVCRIVFVGVFLRTYGVSPWVFAAVELSSSLVWGVGSARCVGLVVDRQWRRLRLWGLVTLAGYVAPDTYVFSRAGRMPTSMIVVLVAVVVISLVSTAVWLLRSVRGARRPVAVA
jgi:hypothetical protein